MTEPQAFQAWITADREEEKARATYDEIMSKFIPVSVGCTIRKGDPSLREEYHTAEAKYIEKRRKADDTFKVWIDMRH